jgi:hypothetical protein
MASTKGRHDASEIARAYHLLIGDGNVTEVRALDAQRGGDYRPGTLFGYFDNAEALAAAVATITSAKGIYFVPNAVNPALLARAANRLKTAGKGELTQDTDIVARRWFLIDADAIRAAGISATDVEHRAALDRIRQIVEELRWNQGWPLPITADSGNGGHAMYRIELPADDGGLVERGLQALAARFTDGAVKVDTVVHNPARIWKLAGTLVCKGDDTPERPWRMARTLRIPEPLQVVQADLLQALAAEAPQPKPQTLPRDGDVHRGPDEAFNVEAFVRRHALDANGPEPWNGHQGPGRRWVFRQSPLCDHHDGAAYILEHASGAVSAGCHHASCSWTWHDLRERFEPRAERPARSTAASATVKPARKPAAIEPFRAFPVESLPSPVRRFVTALASATANDPACASLAALVVLAAVVGNRVAALVKHGWTEAMVLWGAIVARSGTTKSAVLKLATRPLFDMYKVARQQFEEDEAAFRLARQRFEVERDAWKSAAKKGHAGDPPVEPDPPIEQRLVVSDVTTEKLGALMQDNPDGLLLLRDELAAWIGAFDKYAPGGKGSDAPTWLSFFDGAPAVIDRVKAARSIFIERASVSVLGGIQPGVLARVFGTMERESGLLARLLLVQAPTRPVVWTDKELGESTAAAWADLLQGLMEIHPDTDDDGKRRPRLVPLVPDALAVYRPWHDAHGREVADIHADDLAAHFAKLKGICIRLGLLFACVDAVAAGKPVAAIGKAHIEQAIAITEWFKHEARRVYGLLGETDEQRDQRRLVEWIGAKGGAVAVRDLQQGRRGYRTAEDAETALNELFKAGYGAWEHVATTAKGGRPSRVFRLSTVYETPANPAENEVSCSVDAVDGSESQGEQWGEI